MTRHSTLLVVLAGCLPDAPDAPSFQQDVLPILAANCVRCHGYPRLTGAADMRLDGYIDTATATGIIYGAGTYAVPVAAVVRDPISGQTPRYPLDDHQRDTILNWVGDTAFGVPPPRGEPRPGNQPPAVRVDWLGQNAQVITFVYDLHDPDGDLVVGELRAVVGGTEHVIGALHSGRDGLDWDTAGLTGEATLFVVLDDGGETFQMAVPDSITLVLP